MSKFQKIVKKHKSSKKNFNFQNKQGVYYFKNFESFFPLFVASYPKFTAETCTSLIFKPRPDLDMNLYLDFDCKGREPIQFITHDLAKFARKLGKLVGSPEFVLTKRVSSYLKTTKKEQFHAYGFHLWFLGKFSLQQCKMVRDSILSGKLLNPLRKKYNFYNSDEDCVDIAPALRRNGLFLAGDRKAVAPPHYICYAKGKELQYGWQATQQEFYCTLLEEMYSFIWEKPGTIQVLPIPSKKNKAIVESSPSETLPETLSETRFNLPLFLEITKGHVANNTEWKQLCVFFASQGLDCRITNDLVETAWAPFKHTCKLHVEKMQPTIL